MLLLIGATIIIGGYIGISAKLAMKREKKQGFLKEHSPSTILVDTIGAIILREADTVNCKVYRGSYTLEPASQSRDEISIHDVVVYANYYFKYDNVKVEIETTYLSCNRNQDTTSIESISFSVGRKKNIVLTDAEKQKLLQYLKDAYTIKQVKLDAEKEKQRQLDACDALENLMQLEVPLIPIGGSGVSLEKYAVSNTDTGSTMYFPVVTTST